MIYERFRWTCPACALEQIDEVDDVLGPIISATCSGCGGGFNRDKVQQEVLPPLPRAPDNDKEHDDETE